MAKRRVARKPAAKKSPAAKSAAPEAPPASSGLPWPVFAILGCSVLIVVMGSIYWFDLFHGSDKTVASAEDKSESSDDKKDVTDKSDEGNSSKSTDEEEEEPEEGAGDGKEEKDDGEVESTGTFDKPFSEQGKEPKPEEPKEKDPEKTEAKPPTTEKNPKDEPPAKPATPKKDPPKQDPKPTPKPPAKPTDPFVELASALDLPEAGAAGGEPVLLAKLYPEEGKLVNLSLEGGDTILGEKGKIDLVRVPGQRSWNVKLKGTKSGDSQIGLFAIQDNQLTFVWKTSGKEPLADQLRNCRLRVATGAKYKQVALRTPQVVEPLLVKIDKVGAQLPLSVSGIPDGASGLQLEIVNLGASFPKHNFVPDPPIATEGKEVLIKIDGKKVRKVLILQVKFTKRSGELLVSAKPVVEVVGKRDKKKLVPLNIQQAGGELGRLNQEKQQGSLKYESVKKGLRGDKKKLSELDFGYNQWLSQLDLKISRLQSLSVVCGEVHEKAKIEFRVFVEVGGNRVELLRTSGALPGKSDKKTADASSKTAAK